jgi:hypothetical protein
MIIKKGYLHLAKTQDVYPIIFEFYESHNDGMTHQIRISREGDAFYFVRALRECGYMSAVANDDKNYVHHDISIVELMTILKEAYTNDQSEETNE